MARQATRPTPAPRPRFQMDPGWEQKGGRHGTWDKNTLLTLLSL